MADGEDSVLYMNMVAELVEHWTRTLECAGLNPLTPPPCAQLLHSFSVRVRVQRSCHTCGQGGEPGNEARLHQEHMSVIACMDSGSYYDIHVPLQ